MHVRALLARDLIATRVKGLCLLCDGFCLLPPSLLLVCSFCKTKLFVQMVHVHFERKIYIEKGRHAS